MKKSRDTARTTTQIGSALDPAQGHEHPDQQGLVGDRVEPRPQRRAGLEPSRQRAVDAVGDAGRDENPERRPPFVDQDQPDGDRRHHQPGQADQVGQLDQELSLRTGHRRPPRAPSRRAAEPDRPARGPGRGPRAASPPRSASSPARELEAQHRLVDRQTDHLDADDIADRGQPLADLEPFARPGERHQHGHPAAQPVARRRQAADLRSGHGRRRAGAVPGRLRLPRGRAVERRQRLADRGRIVGARDGNDLRRPRARAGVAGQRDREDRPQFPARPRPPCRRRHSARQCRGTPAPSPRSAEPTDTSATS